MTSLTLNGRLWNANDKPLIARVPRLVDAVDWQYHLWDATDLTTYDDAPDPYWTSAITATRVATVADQVGAKPLAKDPGFLGDVFAQPDVPGPLYIESSDFFNGRPAWFSDTALLLQVFFDNWHSALTPHLTRDEEFDYPQPWWGATMIRWPTGVDGNELLIVDGELGAMTAGWHHPSDDYLEFSAWQSFTPVDRGGAIEPAVSGQASDRTYLAMWTVNGTSSSVVVVTRDAAGALVTVEESGTLGSGGLPLTHVHDGWSYTNYRTFLGFGSGTCPYDDLASFCAPMIPPGVV